MRLQACAVYGGRSASRCLSRGRELRSSGRRAEWVPGGYARGLALRVAEAHRRPRVADADGQEGPDTGARPLLGRCRLASLRLDTDWLATRGNRMLSRLLLILLLIPALSTKAQTAALHPMQLGVDADNWSGQTESAAFEASLRSIKIDFISWHIVPEEEARPERLQAIVKFCRKNHWHYLFNT